MEKNLKDKAVNIKGKSYVLVADRIIYFNEKYLNGSIYTELVSSPDNERIIIKATVLPDAGNPNRKYTGYSQAVIGQGYINMTAALENAETSAVGRALAMMGIGVIESVASVDEIRKAESSTPKLTQNTTQTRPAWKPQVRATTAKAYGVQKVTAAPSANELNNLPFN